MAIGLTPTVDTNQPGLRRIQVDRKNNRRQASDRHRHLDRILQAEGHCVTLAEFWPDSSA
jgi:hypothetical protein